MCLFINSHLIGLKNHQYIVPVHKPTLYWHNIVSNFPWGPLFYTQRWRPSGVALKPLPQWVRVVYDPSFVAILDSSLCQRCCVKAANHAHAPALPRVARGSNWYLKATSLFQCVIILSATWIFLLLPWEQQDDKWGRGIVCEMLTWCWYCFLIT